MIVGHCLGIPGKTLKALAVGDPGSQQGAHRVDPDFSQRSSHFRLRKALADPPRVELQRRWRADQEHFVELRGPQRGMGKHVQKAAHQRTAVFKVLGRQGQPLGDNTALLQA
ncbi:hypothetical protein D3C81_822710 [compost metagenome]